MATLQGERGRINAVKGLLSRKGCAYILVTDPVDCEYLSGFHSSHIFLLISKTENLLFTDFRYREAAGNFCRKNPEWKFVETKENGLSILASYCIEPGRIGFQSNSMPVDQYDILCRRLKPQRLMRLRDAVTSLFVAKTAPEIAKMKAAARIGDRAFARTIPQIRLGITEKELAGLLENECRSLGSEKPSFETIVLFGKRSALPHGRPTAQRLKKGDFILFDFGCCVDGFFSDMTRTIVAGSATDRQKEIYGIVAAAQRAASAAVRAEAHASAVDQVARDIITRAGYGAYFGHATGHGVGRLIHEKPRVGRTSKALLPEGAVITIEPGIYLPEFGGVRIEDMVVVRKTGGDIITSSTRRLVELAL
jgi:Xaa-Pro aminopeptidase